MGANDSKTLSCPTTSLPAIAEPRDASAKLASDLDRAAEYARAEKASATRRAYVTDFAIFSAWCAERGALPLPASPVVVAAFLGFERQGEAFAPQRSAAAWPRSAMPTSWRGTMCRLMTNGLKRLFAAFGARQAPPPERKPP